MNSNSQNLSVERKRLLWRATHRGIKEMDIIIGGFALAHLADMEASDLAEFTAIMDYADQEMLAWVTRQTEIPDDLQSPLLTRVLNFRPL